MSAVDNIRYYTPYALNTLGNFSSVVSLQRIDSKWSYCASVKLKLSAIHPSANGNYITACMMYNSQALSSSFDHYLYMRFNSCSAMSF